MDISVSTRFGPRDGSSSRPSWRFVFVSGSGFLSQFFVFGGICLLVVVAILLVGKARNRRRRSRNEKWRPCSFKNTPSHPPSARW